MRYKVSHKVVCGRAPAWLLTQRADSWGPCGTQTGFRWVFIAQVYAFYNLELGLKKVLTI